MDAKTIGYWVSTGLFAFALGSSGVMYWAGQMMDAMTHLGYPEHFVYVLGTWKILGAIALLAPMWPRVKEWAYAGFFFNLTGAAVAHAAVGDGVGGVMPPLVLLVILGASYALRPAALSFGAQPQPALG